MASTFIEVNEARWEEIHDERDRLESALSAATARAEAAERENAILRANAPKSILRRLEAQGALKAASGID